MSWLAVAAWGGAVGLDAASLLQVMVSRPLVAGPVTGVLLGRPLAGIAIGVLLELFALVILPIGAARYPDSGTAAVAAAAGYAGTAGADLRPDLLLLAVVFGLVWERVGGASVNALRRLNERLMTGAEERRPLTAGRLERLHLAALALDFARGAAVAAGGAALAAALLRSAGTSVVLGAGTALGVLGVASAAMAAAAASLFGGWSHRRLALALGVLCGLVLLLLG